MLTVLAERCSTYNLQFAPCKGRFYNIGRIGAAFPCARADNGMQFVYKKNYILVFFNGFQNIFQAFFKIAPVFGTGHKIPDFQRKNGFAAQKFRHLAVNNALCQAFGHACFAYTGLAD